MFRAKIISDSESPYFLHLMSLSNFPNKQTQNKIPIAHTRGTAPNRILVFYCQSVPFGGVSVYFVRDTMIGQSFIVAQCYQPI